jgi:pilus assembly protein CpaF
MEGEQVVISELFKFLEEGRNPQGKVTGQLRATGMRPVFASRLEEAGYRMPTVMGSSSSEARPLSAGKT